MNIAAHHTASTASAVHAAEADEGAEARRDVLRRMFRDRLTEDTIDDLVTAGLDVSTVCEWVTGGTAALLPREAGWIPDLLDAGLTRRRVRRYNIAGVYDPQFILALFTDGCPPQVVENHGDYAPADHACTARTFADEYRTARSAGASLALCNAVLGYGGTPEDVHAWHTAGASPQQAALATLAGLTAADAATGPVDLTDTTALATLAVLRGHPVTLPITIPMLDTRPRPAGRR